MKNGTLLTNGLGLVCILSLIACGQGSQPTAFDSSSDTSTATTENLKALSHQFDQTVSGQVPSVPPIQVPNAACMPKLPTTLPATPGQLPVTPDKLTDAQILELVEGSL